MTLLRSIYPVKDIWWNVADN